MPEIPCLEFTHLVGALILRLTIDGRDCYGAPAAEARTRALNEAVHKLAGLLMRAGATMRSDPDLRAFLEAVIEPLSPRPRSEALELIRRTIPGGD